MTDAELLASYAATGSEGAFGEIVGRYAPMVYSTCRRALGEGPAADDAAQATFLVLVRKVRRLPPDTELAGWLYLTARHAAADAVKQAARRARHEREAMTMRARAAGGEPAPAGQEPLRLRWRGHKLTHSYHDAVTYGPVLAAGRIGLRHWGGRMDGSYQDFRVWRLAGAEANGK